MNSFTHGFGVALENVVLHVECGIRRGLSLAERGGVETDAGNAAGLPSDLAPDLSLARVDRPGTVAR